MNDTITIYYYTAWDGYAWQGCDAATAKSLQSYIEAAGTLPRSSADKYPFGGAVPCKIAGQIGVAVYRYHTRIKGDLSGRDSLYIALAFVPMEVGTVDFAKLLELTELSETKAEELRPEKISVSEKGLNMPGSDKVPPRWMDRDGYMVEYQYRELKGREGLQTLSRLFFSEKTQLGFLNAVFSSESGLDDLVSNQTYSVYPEVLKVESAAAAFERAKESKGDFPSKDSREFVEITSALRELDQWATKLGYKGLRAYCDEKRRMLFDDAERLDAIQKFQERLKCAVDNIRDVNISCDGRFMEDLLSKKPNIKDLAEQCAKLAMDIVSLKVLDHSSYFDAIRFSLEAMRNSACILGALCGVELVQKAEQELMAEKAKSDELSQELNKLRCKVKEQDDEIKTYKEKNGDAVKKPERQLFIMDPAVNRNGNLGENVILQKAESTDSGHSWLHSRIMDRLLTILIVVFLSILGFLAFKIFFPAGCVKMQSGDSVNVSGTNDWSGMELGGGANPASAIVKETSNIANETNDLAKLGKRVSDSKENGEKADNGKKDAVPEVVGNQADGEKMVVEDWTSKMQNEENPRNDKGGGK